MKIGYARVSTDEQNLEAQLVALQGAGAERIFSEKVSGKARNRPELRRMIDQLRDGDVVMVWKLDRLARRTYDALLFVEEIDRAGGALVSLTEPFDLSVPAGRAMAQMLFVLAELERSNIVERTKAGLETARANGRKGGRPPVLSTNQQTRVRNRHTKGESISALAREYGVGRSTIRRCLV